MTMSLVVNPSAGLGRARKLLPKVVTELVTGMPGVDLKVHLAESFADARRLCEQAASQSEPGDALLVMGGDGMMHLGANACAGTDVTLGMIPAGTGNDSCRGLGLPPANPVAAARVVIGGHTRRVDLARATGTMVGAHRDTGEYVVSVLSTGFDARVNLRANHAVFPRGRLRYAYSALIELASFEPRDYRLTIDGQVREVSAMVVAVGNAGFLGGGMRICPHADVTDGRLDVTIVHPVSRMTLVRLMPALFTGDFIRDPAVELLRAEEVTVDGRGLVAMADGDELGRVPITMAAAPGVLDIFTPYRGPARRIGGRSRLAGLVKKVRPAR